MYRPGQRRRGFFAKLLVDPPPGHVFQYVQRRCAIAQRQIESIS
jgi:hypothetical protein